MSSNNTLIDIENLSPDDPLFWSLPTPVNCNGVRVVGILLWMSALAGVTINGALLGSFVRYRALRSASNTFLMFIAGMGLVASCTIFPLTGTSSLYCQWVFQRAGCIFDAVIAFLHGTASCYLLCAVSVTRCYIIVRPFDANKVTAKKCAVASCVLILLSFLITILPLMGWNEYTIERARISCCISWQNQSFLYVSYTLFLFIFVYVVPLAILSITNTITLYGIKRMREKIENGIQVALSAKRIEMERRIVKSVIMTTLGFVITWTPYAVAFFLAAFRGKDYGTPPAVAFVCACFAKSSVIWIPIIYAGTSTQFQWSFVKLTALNDGDPTNRVGPANTFNQSHQGTTIALKAVKSVAIAAKNNDSM